MSTEMIVTLIASGTSFLVATVGLIASLITRSQSARSDKAIEELKFEFSRALSREAISDAQWNDALKSLQMGIQSIQHFKDEILLILAAIDSSLDTRSAIERLTIARTNLWACHEERMTTLNKQEEEALHRAKNLALDIERFVAGSLQGQANASALSEEGRQRLLQLRNELTELQQLLRDRRSDRLIQRIGNG